MSNSQLKKEFNQRDVNRLRNLITKNYGSSTRIQSGYEKLKVDYKEGDVWEENGKKWTIKNGIKQTVTKFDSLKHLFILPLTCPECSNHMKITDLNKKMYNIHGKCFDCVVETETKLKINGEFDEYEKNILNLNKDSYVDDLEQALEDWLRHKDTFVSEDGVLEDWSEESKKQDNYNKVKEAIKNLRDKKI